MKEITVRNKNEDRLCMNRKSILNVEEAVVKEITVRNKNEDGLCMNRKSILNVENISENDIENIVNGDKNGVEDLV